jgi:hypothetical protein
MKGSSMRAAAQTAPIASVRKVVEFPVDLARASRAPGARPMLLGPDQVKALRADLDELTDLTDRANDDATIAAMIARATGARGDIAAALAVAIGVYVLTGGQVPVAPADPKS